MNTWRRAAALAVATLMAAAVSAAEVKDPNPPLAGPPAAPEATGGPDGFGYTFADDAEPTCAVAGFVDISATGTLVGTGDDDGFPVTLGAAFDFYGASFTQLAAATNGYISTDLTDAGPDLSNDCPLPVVPSTGGGARMYPLHDDLVIGEEGPGGIYYQYFATCPRQSDRCAANEACSVFMWDNAEHFGGGGETFDFEAILYHTTNDFVYVIGTGNPETGSGSTTGIQNAPPPTTGLTYACNTAGTVPDGRRVCFFHPNTVPASCALNADLGITKTASAPIVPVGSPVTFTLTASNTGPAAAAGVVVTDSLPAGLTYVSNSCGATFAAPTLTWNVGALAVAGSVACNVVATVTGAGPYVNTATIASSSPDPVSTNNAGTVTVAGQAPSVLEIPTLGGLGLAALALALAVASLLFLRRRPA